MMLHASNALAGSARSRRALWHFMLAAIGTLTLLMAGLALPAAFELVGHRLLGVDASLAGPARLALATMCLWPAAIGWRRYFQGLLIYAGRGGAVARAGVLRLVVVGVLLAGGLAAGIGGVPLAAVTLITGVLAEAACVTALAYRCGVVDDVHGDTRHDLPADVPAVWRFYWPLAGSMLVVWGGRAALIGVVARAVDGPVALAAWPAAWGLVLLVANGTRMVQQVIIRNRGVVPDAMLASFAASVGAVFSLVLLAIGATAPGAALVRAFVGHDPALVSRVGPVVVLCTAVPFLVALQNALQGFLIGSGNTRSVTAATWAGTAVLLGSATWAVATGTAGAAAAASAMVGGLTTEVIGLSLALPALRRPIVDLAGALRSGTGLQEQSAIPEPGGSHCHP